MRSQSSLENRLDELEIKASYTEDLLETLNLTIYRQQQQIDRLHSELVQLREQAARQLASGATAAISDPREELPPHY
jgi:SlyX protein